MYGTDITERKRAEATAAQLAAIVESSFDAIIGKDLHSIVTSWNLGAERVFGYTAGEMIGCPITRIIPPDRLDDEAEHDELNGTYRHGSLISVCLGSCDPRSWTLDERATGESAAPHPKWTKSLRTMHARARRP